MFGINQWLGEKAASIAAAGTQTVNYLATSANQVYNYTSETITQTSTAAYNYTAETIAQTSSAAYSYTTETIKQTSTAAYYYGVTKPCEAAGSFANGVGNAVNYLADKKNAAVGYVGDQVVSGINKVAVTTLDAMVATDDYATYAGQKTQAAVYATAAAMPIVVDKAAQLSAKTLHALDVSQKYMRKHYQLDEYWQGYTQFLDPNIAYKIIRNPKTKKVFYNCLRSNILFYINAVLFYEAGVKPILRSYIPYYQDSYAEFFLNLLAVSGISAMAVNMKIKNTILYPLALRKTITEEEKTAQALPADCQSYTSKMGMIASIAYNQANLLQAEFIGLITGSVLLKNLFLAKAIGQAMAELKLANFCTEDRYAQLNKNNAYTFGIGTSLLFVSWLLSNMVNRMSGVRSHHVDLAIFSLVSQYFLIAASVNEDPLPGKENGKEPFYYARYVTEKMLKDSVIATLKTLTKRANQKFILDTIKKFPQGRKQVNDFITNAANIYQVNAFIYPDFFKTLEKYAGVAYQSTSIPLFLDVFDHSIVEAINFLQTLVSKQNEERAAYFLNFFPKSFITKQFKQDVEMIFTESQDFFADLSQLFAKEPVAILHTQTTLQQDVVATYIRDPKVDENIKPLVTILDKEILRSIKSNLTNIAAPTRQALPAKNNQEILPKIAPKTMLFTPKAEPLPASAEHGKSVKHAKPRKPAAYALSKNLPTYLQPHGLFAQAKSLQKLLHNANIMAPKKSQ